MPSIHPVNFIVAVLSFGACFLIPLVLETGEHDSAAPTRLRGDTRWLLRLPWNDGVLRNVVTPAERIEASRRARFWLRSLDGLHQLGTFPAGAARPCAAQLAWTIIRAAGEAQAHQAHLSRNVEPRVVVVTSTWFGSMAAALVERGASPLSIEMIGVGSAHSCELFQDAFTLQSDFQEDRIVSCISSTGGYVLGESLLCACVASDRCSCRVETNPTAATTVPLSAVDGSLYRLVPGVPLDTFAGVQHHVDGSSRRSTALLVVDVEPSSAVLGFHAAVEAGRSIEAGSLQHFLWVLRLPVEETAHLAVDILSLIDAWRSKGLEAAALHGDCVASRHSPSTNPADGATNGDEHLRAFFVRGDPGDPSGPWYRMCVLLLRSGRRAHEQPLETLLREAAAATPLNTPPSGVTLWMRLSSYGLYSVAFLIGLALCYGISKNWWKRRRRHQLLHSSGRQSQLHLV